MPKGKNVHSYKYRDIDLAWLQATGQVRVLVSDSPTARYMSATGKLVGGGDITDTEYYKRLKKINQKKNVQYAN